MFVSRPAVIAAGVAVLAAGALIFGLWQTNGVAANAQVVSLSGSTMGTSWNIQLAVSDKAPSAALAGQISTSLERLDRQIFSTYSSNSELSVLNQTPVGVVTGVSAEMLQVLQLAQTVHSLSQGAFDITVGALVDLWGFGPQWRDTLPSDQQVAQGLARKGMQFLVLDGTTSTITKMQDIKLDLSAIAKGYAVDVIAGLLEANGWQDYVVEIGGELRVKGYKAPGTAWQLAVETPTQGPRAAFSSFTNAGLPLAVAGSGDYRNYREPDAVRYSHEIDPRTGRPVAHSLASVTVVAETAALADAWATALIVQGPEDGLQTANSLGLQAYFIIRADQGLVARSSHTFQERYSR